MLHTQVAGRYTDLRVSPLGTTALGRREVHAGDGHVVQAKGILDAGERRRLERGLNLALCSDSAAVTRTHGDRQGVRHLLGCGHDQGRSRRDNRAEERVTQHGH